ncbi:MAG: orotidine 5'-phosphate decarboxylase / HUMPS family protein [Nanoarchaeota archaeon]|nr:orotidine 5'-phosphate decarboxylase / HUMPS family protein [Nanoarchaeota archaeon]
MSQKVFPSVMVKSQKELDQMLSNLHGVAKYLHLDVADGKFVPSRSLWFPFKLSTKFKYIAHLMVENPIAWIRKHGKKVEFCVVQAETVNISNYIRKIKLLNKKVAFALKPETRVGKIKNYLKDIDYVLILTVHPGFYGKKYLQYPLKKIAEIKKMNPKVKVIVDGGMNYLTVKDAAKAGADYIISGSFITKAENPKERMREMEKGFSGK